MIFATKAYSKVNISYAIQLTGLEFGLVIGAGRWGGVEWYRTAKDEFKLEGRALAPRVSASNFSHSPYRVKLQFLKTSFLVTPLLFVKVLNKNKHNI